MVSRVAEEGSRAMEAMAHASGTPLPTVERTTHALAATRDGNDRCCVGFDHRRGRRPIAPRRGSRMVERAGARQGGSCVFDSRTEVLMTVADSVAPLVHAALGDEVPFTIRCWDW